ncbi:MAG: hypothetical protein ABIT05_10205 [Chitinophagaceae bacterium]
MKIVFALCMVFSLAFITCSHKRGSRIFSCKRVPEQYFNLLKDTGNSEALHNTIGDLNRIIAESSGCSTAYMLLGDIYLSSNEYNLAENNFRYSLKIKGDNIYSIFRMGILFLNRGINDSAVRYFDLAERMKNKNGFVIDDTHEFEDVTGIPSFDIEYSKIIFNRAIANYRAGNYLNSMYDLNYCIKHNILANETYFYRGLVHLKIDDFERACSDFNSAKLYGNDKASKFLKENNCVHFLSQKVH